MTGNADAKTPSFIEQIRKRTQTSGADKPFATPEGCALWSVVFLEGGADMARLCTAGDWRSW